MFQTQRALDRLKRVQLDLHSVQSSMDWQIANGSPTGSLLHSAKEARASSEVTYLLRLFAAFENGLKLIGPELLPPISFTGKDGLGVKVERIGSQVSLPSAIRSKVDADLRAFRNELMHGRSHILPFGFDESLDLMKAFLRWCP